MNDSNRWRRSCANFETVRMAKLLGVSRSDYYAWAHRKAQGLSKGTRSQAVLDERVRVFHATSDGVYRALRITADFRDSGTSVNAKTVAASLHRQGLEGVSPRGSRPVTTIPEAATRSILDRVQRVWDTSRLNAVWISDITYLRTGEGWLYRYVVRDGCSRQVLGWAMDTHQLDNQLPA